MLLPAVGRAVVVGVGRRTPHNIAAPAIASGVSSWLTLGTLSSSLGAESRGEHEGGLGFASRLTGGELSPSPLLLCSVSPTCGAPMSARAGGSNHGPRKLNRAGPVAGLGFLFLFFFYYFIALNARFKILYLKIGRSKWCDSNFVVFLVKSSFY
jgi:hypothetical protein